MYARRIILALALVALPRLASGDAAPVLKVTDGTHTCYPVYTLTCGATTCGPGGTATCTPGSGAVITLNGSGGISSCGPIAYGGSCTLSPTYGTSANTFCQGNDARLPPTPTLATAGAFIQDNGATYSRGPVCTAGQLMLPAGAASYTCGKAGQSVIDQGYVDLVTSQIVGGAKTFTTSVQAPVVASTQVVAGTSGDITIDPTLGSVFLVAQTGNITSITIAPPSVAGQDGQYIFLVLDSDGTHSWPTEITNASIYGLTYYHSPGSGVDALGFVSAGGGWAQVSIIRGSRKSTTSAWSASYTAAPAPGTTLLGGFSSTNYSWPGRVTCMWSLAGTGGGNFTVNVVDVTAGSTVCSCTVGSCAAAGSTSPLSCDCAGATSPVTPGHNLSLVLDGGSCGGGTSPQDVHCTVESLADNGR